MANVIYATRGSRPSKGFYEDSDFGGNVDYHDSSNTNLLGSATNAQMDPRTKCLIAFAVISSVCIIGGVVGGLVGGLTLYQPAVPTTLAPATTTSQASLQFIGQACNQSTQCIPSAYCDSTSKVCSCSPEFYYDSTSGTCRTRKGYGESCVTSTECEFNMLLLCSSSTCQCDSMLFWNPYTHRCEDKRGLGESCVGVPNECYASRMICGPIEDSETNRCLCPLDTHFFSFFTGDCEVKKVYGATCYATFECIDFAWCTQFPGDSQSRCNCIPSYYYDAPSSTCKPKKGYMSACSNGYECIDNMLSLTCVNGKCGCPTNSVWNGTACDYLKPYGGICNKTSDCLNYGTVCSWLPEQNIYACVCPSGQYFSLTNNSCTGFKQLGQICSDTSQCGNNATCLWQSTTSDMRCQCTVSTFYQSDPYTCLFLKSVNESCTSSAQCQIRSGLLCSSGLCQCDPNYYWNGVECQTKKTYTSNSYSMYCVNSYECKDALGLTNCFNGVCRCAPSKSWNGLTCT